jgi:hypothetical protein
MKKIEKLALTQENFIKYASLYTRSELAILFCVSVGLIDIAKKSWQIKRIMDEFT